MTQKDITTGAGNDIERATALARRMVCEWGMSELGPLAFGQGDEPVFLGRDFQQKSAYSEDTAERIDTEVQRIVKVSYEKARGILERYREVLDKVSNELLERESLDGSEVYRMIEEMTGQKLEPAPVERRTGEPPAPPAATATAKSGADAAPTGKGPDFSPSPSPA